LQVIGANIYRGVVVSVAGEFAHATFKHGLFRTIGARHMFALRTLLRGITGVNKHNTDSHSLRLVFHKCLQLGKAPFVKPLAHILKMNNLHEIRSVLKHKGINHL